MQSQKLKQQPKPSGAPQPQHSWSFEAIGTQWWIGVYEQHSANAIRGLQKEIRQRIETFDKAYSRFRADSLVSAIAQKPGTYKMPPDSGKLFALYRKLYDITDGFVTPLIGQTLSDAGYDADYTLQSKVLHTPPKWDDVMTYDANILTTRRPVLLDFGAAGKGYLVDIVADICQRQGVGQYCIDAGGDMRCELENVLRIGLENPDDTSQAVGVAELRQGALCGSAGNRRVWSGYHHIIDPKTLSSPKDIRAVWVVAATTFIADAIATALYFVPPEKLAQAFSFSYAILGADGALRRSEHFPAQFFISKGTSNQTT